jgi:hypothetical protein
MRHSRAFLKVRFGDIILAAVTLAVSVSLIVLFAVRPAPADPVAVVIQRNAEVARIRLNEVASPYTIRLDGDFENVITVEKGRIRYEVSDCPDKVCVHTGWLSRDGDVAACLPNQSYIKVTGGQDNGVDIVAN